MARTPLQVKVDLKASVVSDAVSTPGYDPSWQMVEQTGGSAYVMQSAQPQTPAQLSNPVQESSFMPPGEKTAPARSFNRSEKDQALNAATRNFFPSGKDQDLPKSLILESSERQPPIRSSYEADTLHQVGKNFRQINLNASGMDSLVDSLTGGDTPMGKRKGHTDPDLLPNMGFHEKIQNHYEYIESPPEYSENPTDPEDYKIFRIGDMELTIYRPHIDPDDIDPKYLEDQFDIALLYADDDRESALAFRDFLEKIIELDDGKPPKVCVVDDHISWVRSRLKHLGEALERSTYVFLFVTKTFCEDAWAELQKDECIMASLNDPRRRWSVVPIATQPRYDIAEPDKAYKMPIGMMSLKPIDLSRLTSGRDFKDVAYLLNSTKVVDEKDRYFRRFLTNMLSRSINMRRKREREQDERKQRWIENETEQLWQEEAERKYKEIIEKMRNEKKKQMLEDKLSADGQRRLNDVQPDTKEESRSTSKGNRKGEPQTVTNNMTGDAVHYHYHLPDGTDVAQLPAFPPASQHIYNVAKTGAIQVGDKNTLEYAEYNSQVVTDGPEPSTPGEDNMTRQPSNSPFHDVNDNTDNSKEPKHREKSMNNDEDNNMGGEFPPSKYNDRQHKSEYGANPDDKDRKKSKESMSEETTFPGVSFREPPYANDGWSQQRERDRPRQVPGESEPHVFEEFTKGDDLEPGELRLNYPVNQPVINPTATEDENPLSLTSRSRRANPVENATEAEQTSLATSETDYSYRSSKLDSMSSADDISYSGSLPSTVNPEYVVGNGRNDSDYKFSFTSADPNLEKKSSYQSITSSVAASSEASFELDPTDLAGLQMPSGGLETTGQWVPNIEERHISGVSMQESITVVKQRAQSTDTTGQPSIGPGMPDVKDRPNTLVTTECEEDLSAFGLSLNQSGQSFNQPQSKSPTSRSAPSGLSDKASHNSGIQNNVDQGGGNEIDITKLNTVLPQSQEASARPMELRLDVGASHDQAVRKVPPSGSHSLGSAGSGQALSTSSSTSMRGMSYGYITPETVLDQLQGSILFKNPPKHINNLMDLDLD